MEDIDDSGMVLQTVWRFLNRGKDVYICTHTAAVCIQRYVHLHYIHALTLTQALKLHTIHMYALTLCIHAVMHTTLLCMCTITPIRGTLTDIP